MVQQARDQLESNQTQSDLKAVFEGSCKLIPIHSVANECCKLADDFIPELVEALASQMNPQVSNINFDYQRPYFLSNYRKSL
jgi:saposin